MQSATRKQFQDTIDGGTNRRLVAVNRLVPGSGGGVLVLLGLVLALQLCEGSAQALPVHQAAALPHTIQLDGVRHLEQVVAAAVDQSLTERAGDGIPPGGAAAGDLKPGVEEVAEPSTDGGREKGMYQRFKDFGKDWAWYEHLLWAFAFSVGGAYFGHWQENRARRRDSRQNISL